MKKNELFILTLFIVFNFLYFVDTTLVKAEVESQEKSEKVIYLTFDDGPSSITYKVLDILKENNVKATFFIIGNQIKGYENIVERINEEGHSIGLHTYTHNFKTIYASKKSFIKEMLDTREEINKVIGTSPNIIRFPGGSRKRLNDEMLKLLHSYNFKTYDWNMNLSDGLRPQTPPDKLFREATRELDKPEPIILLMHCDYMHKNTCKVLPRIIKYYKDKGYEFKVIKEDTPEYYFPYKKATFFNFFS